MVRVLIAEDERDIAEVVTFGVRLVWSDTEVVVAASGAETLARFAEQRPDLVVDIAIPPPLGSRSSASSAPGPGCRP